MKIFGRDPALISALATSAIALVAAFFVPISVDQQALLNAFVAAILGVVTAFALKTDGYSAAILGLVKAGLALGIGFGLAWTPLQQAVALSFAAAVTGMFVRTQEQAPTPATVREVAPPHVEA